MLKAGDRIGDWIIESPLGEGGMGAVFRVHSALSERVDAALKVMKPSLEPDARARFVREAEALSALRHPAIVRVMGFSEDTRRGLLYLVMELAEGETLKRRLERGPMTLPEALATFVPLAGALERAHAEGISHRDLKPSNIVLTPDGPCLVDFGIAAAAQSGELTGKGHLGTLSYLPPEVFRGERAEPRGIDVYGLGLLLNEALTGVHPFPMEAGLTPAAALATVGMRKLQQPALDPGEAVPERLRKLVRAATSPDPRTRPDMALMHRILASLLERRGGAAAPAAAEAESPRVPAWSPPPDRTMRVPDPVSTVGGGTGSTTSSHVRRRFRERRRSVIVAWVASMVAAALLAALIILMAHGPGRTIESLRPESSPLPAASPARATGAGVAPIRVISPRVAPSPALLPSPTAVPSVPTPPPTTRPTPAPSPTPTTRPSPAPSPTPTTRPSPPPSPTPSTRPSPAPSPARPATEPTSPRPIPSPRASASTSAPTPRPSAPAPHPSPVATPLPAEAAPEPTPTPSPSPSPSPPR
ncbi:MAG TPA: serine/threonine-protein kinase [Vicinamibacteria bacterium]|nr:serine/threonine-protein kinase [Vicinamibacteria bacterium]